MKNLRKRILLVGLVLILTVEPVFAKLDLEDHLRAYLVGDYETGKILEAYNIEEQVEIASITKLMTYMVVEDAIASGELGLDSKIPMDKESMAILGSTIKFDEGRAYSVDQLINASLVASANNATYRLATYIAGTEANFVHRMEEKAREIGLEASVFYNSTGLPVVGLDDQNKMKVTDIFKMSRFLIKNYPQVLDRTSLVSLDFKDREGETVRNTNPILHKVRGVDGLKTGFTYKAGYSNVSTLVREPAGEGEEEIRLIGILMGAKSEKARDELSQILMDYSRDSYRKKVFLDRKKPLKLMEDIRSKPRLIEVYPAEDFKEVLGQDEILGLNLDFIGDLYYPLDQGTVIGRASITKGDRLVFESDLLVQEDIRKANPLVVVFRSIGEMFKKLGKIFD